MSGSRKDPAKVDETPGNEENPSGPPDDHLTEWAEEDQQIEDRKPDLGEIEEDTSEL